MRELLKTLSCVHVLLRKRQGLFPMVAVLTVPIFVWSGQEASPQYVGEPITINMQDVRVEEFLVKIHEVSGGLEIVLDPTVCGHITLVAEEIPWDQAFHVVMQNNGLLSKLEGATFRVMTVESAIREQEARRPRWRSRGWRSEGHEQKNAPPPTLVWLKTGVAYESDSCVIQGDWVEISRECTEPTRVHKDELDWGRTECSKASQK